MSGPARGLSRAALYARYSTEHQSARSVDDQLALCQAYATTQGMAVVARYDDAAISGNKLTQRLGLQRLLRDAKQGLFNVLVVEHADRLSRHPGDIHTLREALNFAGVRILQVDGGELDGLAASVSGLVSHLTIAAGIEKTKRGMAARAVQGLSMGGRAYGYATVKGEPGQLVIVAQEADIVRRIFRDYVAGASARTIAHALNAEGITAPRGGRWNGSVIGGWGQRGTGIISNALYRGELTWGKVRMIRDPETRRRISRPVPAEQWKRAHVPALAIIDADLWERAQQRRHGRRAGIAVRRPKHLLSGLLRCPECGGALVVKDRVKSGTKLRCGVHHEQGLCGEGRTWIMERIETAVIGGLRELLTSPEAIEAYATAYAKERKRLARSRAHERPALARQLQEVSADLDRAIGLLISGAASPATLSPHIAALEKRKGDLATKLAETVAPTVVTLQPAAGRRLAQQLESLAATAQSREEVGTALRQLVGRITPRNGYDLEIEGDLAALITPSPDQAGGFALVAGVRSERQPPIPFRLCIAA